MFYHIFREKMRRTRRDLQVTELNCVIVRHEKEKKKRGHYDSLLSEMKET